MRAARPAKHHQGSFGGSWVCFRRFLDVSDHFQYNFHVFHWFCMDIGTSGVLYAAIVSGSRQKRKNRNPRCCAFFSAASDRFGRLSRRIRGLLGCVQKASDGFFDIFPGSGRKIVHKNVKISNFRKFALLGGSLKGPVF